MKCYQCDKEVSNIYSHRKSKKHLKNCEEVYIYKHYLDGKNEEGYIYKSLYESGRPEFIIYIKK